MAKNLMVAFSFFSTINVAFINPCTFGFAFQYRTRTKGYLIDHVDQSHLRFHDENGGCVITGETSIVKVPGFLEVA